MKVSTFCVVALFATIAALAQPAQSLPSFGIASRRILSTASGSSLNWTRVSTLGTNSAPALVHHSAAILSFNSTNRSMVLFGGRTLTDSGWVTLTSAVWSLDVDQLTWTKIVTTGLSPAVREKHSACSNGTHMLVHGGMGSTVLGDTWLLEWESKTWQAVPASRVVSATLSGHTSVWIGGTVYLFGGKDGSNLNQNRLILLNVATSTWSEVSSSGSTGWPYERSLHSAAVLEDCMFIYGGQYQVAGSVDDVVALGDVWSYCPNSSQWNATVTSTGYWELTGNETLTTNNHSAAPVSGHVTVSVSDSLMVSVSGHNPYFSGQTDMYASPVIRAFEYYGDVARKVLGSWQSKDSSSNETCAAIASCSIDYASVTSCQAACDLSAHLGCNAIEFRMLTTVAECCMQTCTDPIGSQTTSGFEGHARHDSYEFSSFVFPPVAVASDVPSEIEGHTAVSLDNTIFVYGGQEADGSILGTLSSFVFLGSGCPEGSKSLANSATCGLCDTGTFASAVGGYSCIRCGPGKYASLPGSSSCSQCPAGTFRTGYGGTSTSDCESCPSGKHSSVEGATNTAVCVNCSPGTYSPSRAVECFPCSPGSYNPNDGQPGNTSADGCALCLPGSYSFASSNNCTLCDAGKYNAKSGRTICLPCPAGYYGTDDRTACESCSAGYFSSEKAALNSSVCLGCNAGSYSYAASSTCTDCSVGRYASGTLNKNSTECSPCPVGRASAGLGASSLDSCEMCVPGSYSADTGAGMCTKCAQSKFLEVYGAIYESDCEDCPAGKSSMSDGSSKATDCVSCETGYGQNQAGVCTVCETGRFSTISASTANATCAMCGVGKYADLTEQSTCLECEAGKFAQRGWVSCSSCNASFECASCSEHGTCQLGTCVCASGYSGADCTEELCPSTNCDPSIDTTIYFEQSLFRVREDNVATAVPTLIRRGCCDSELTLNVSLVADSALLGSDFSASVVPAVFIAGSDRATVNIPVVQDSLVETCKILNITADLSNVLSDGTTLSARVELEDDDVDSAKQYSTIKSASSSVKPSMLNIYLAPRENEAFTFTVNVTRPEDAQCIGCPTGDSDCVSAHGAASYCQPGSFTCSGHSTPCVCTGCSDKEIDILLIQDLSASFGDDLPNTKQLVANMMADLTSIYPNVNFGVASFVDKPIAPFGETGDYEWRVHRPLTADTISVDNAVDALTLFKGGNAEESQLTALLQASKQHSVVGWRDDAYRIAIVITDAPFAYEGFGAQAAPPITTPNNEDTVMDSLNEDYPSIDMVRVALREQSIRPLFAVTSNVKTTYDDLVTALGDGITFELEPDSSNLVSVVRDGVRQLEETVTLVSDASSYWEEWSSSALSGTVTTHGVSCYDLDTAKAHCEAASTACSGVSEWSSCATLSAWRLHSDRQITESNFTSWLHVGDPTNLNVAYLGTDGTLSEMATGIKGGETASFSVTLNSGNIRTGDASFSLLSPGLGRSLVYVSRDEPVGCSNSCPNDCSGHGTCTVSVCNCDAAYAWHGTDDCSISSGELVPGLANNGDMESGNGADDGAIGWAGSGAGYTHDTTVGYGAQDGSSLLLKPDGVASQIVYAGEKLPVNAMPMAVSVWSKASATDTTTTGVIAGRAHYMSLVFIFSNGTTWTDVTTFDSGVYGWRGYSKQYLSLPALQSISITFTLPDGTLGSEQGAAYVDAFSLLPDPLQACFCEDGFYWLDGHVGDCKQCEPGFFCGGGGKFNCGDNEYSQGAATECSACPKGWLCEDGIGYPCASPNFLHTNSKTSTAACLPCPYGHDCSGGYATPCAAGSYAGVGMNQCLLCHSTEMPLCPDRPGTISSECGSQSCSQCPEGTTSNYARTGCLGCAPGEWSSVGSHPCSTCAPGRYSEGGSASQSRLPDYTQVASDQWCYPSSDSRTTLFLYGFDSLNSCYQKCSTTEGCVYFAYWYGDHTGTCTLWTECTDDIESQGPHADSVDFFSSTASVEKCDGSVYCPSLAACYDQCQSLGLVGDCNIETCCPSTTSASYQLGLYDDQDAQWYVCNTSIMGNSGEACFGSCNSQHIANATTTTTTDSTTFSSHGYYNRVYKLQSTPCQADMCNHKQVGIQFGADTTSLFHLETATWNSYTATLEFWLYVPTSLESSEIVVSKLTTPADRYANSRGWLVELDADSVTLRFTTISSINSGACADSFLSDGTAWVDSVGDNCDGYVSNQWCAQYGDGYANGGLTANQACCGCGGGDTYAPSVYTKSMSLTPGNWSHVAIVMNVIAGDASTDITFVVNGQDATGLQGTCCGLQQSEYDAGTDYSGTDYSDHSYGTPNVTSLLLGDASVKFGPAMSGLKITGIRMWDAALSTSTLASYMDSCVESSHPYFANLKHNFELDQGSGQTVQDSILTSVDEIGFMESGMIWWAEALAAPSLSPSSSPTVSSNATLCTACSIGFYAELEGLTTCVACGDGTNTTTVGTVNASSCVATTN